MYYSVFNLVRIYARNRYGFWSETDVHATLIEHFRNNRYDEYDTFHKDLKYLKDCRVVCDYKFHHVTDPTMMDTCNEAAKRIIDFIDRTSRDPKHFIVPRHRSGRSP